ncbi:MAG: hypothetical protein K0S30_1153 [Clostridia bacterium]|jgi:hypothetical protein|nr:hypothetical protein [Clostridia bacterium]
MNKLKVIYDAVKIMKDKEAIKGVFKAEGVKGEAKLFSINNTFEKTSAGCQTKGKTNIEVECDGKKMKMENSIQFETEGSGRGYGFRKHMHGFHNNCSHGMHGGSLKEKLEGITALLGILSSIELSEKEGGAAVLVLKSADIPQEIKAGIQAKLKDGLEHHKQMMENKQHPMCMKELRDMENIEFELMLVINPNKEIEKITVDISGVQKDEKDEKAEAQEVKLTADLSLEW